MSIGQLRNLCGHICDLSNHNPYLREPYFDDKLCIISAPVAVYIPVASRGVFVQSPMDHFSNSNRFLAPSDQPNRLLVSSHPLKMLTSTVQSALQVADIRVVDVMCFGTKAIPPLFGFDFLAEYSRVTQPIVSTLDILLMPKMIQLHHSVGQLKNNLVYHEPLASAVLSGLQRRYGSLLALEMPLARNATTVAVAHPQFKLRWVPPAERESVCAAFSSVCEKQS